MSSPVHRRSDARLPAVGSPPARRRASPVLALQGMIGNRATGHVLARNATDHGTVHIGKLPAITVVGGNTLDWAAKKDPETLEITAKAGKHSAALEKMSKARTKVPLLKLTTPLVGQDGQHLDYGTVEIEFKNARISGYALDGKVETWRAVDFDGVHRTTKSRKIGT